MRQALTTCCQAIIDIAVVAGSAYAGWMLWQLIIEGIPWGLLWGAVWAWIGPTVIKVAMYGALVALFSGYAIMLFALSQAAAYVDERCSYDDDGYLWCPDDGRWRRQPGPNLGTLHSMAQGRPPFDQAGPFHRS